MAAELTLVASECMNMTITTSSSKQRVPAAIEWYDVATLRAKAENCLKWSKDPARKDIANMTVDEAAAIMLYTQGISACTFAAYFYRESSGFNDLKLTLRW